MSYRGIYHHPTAYYNDYYHQDYIYNHQYDDRGPHQFGFMQKPFTYSNFIQGSDGLNQYYHNDGGSTYYDRHSGKTYYSHDELFCSFNGKNENCVSPYGEWKKLPSANAYELRNEYSHLNHRVFYYHPKNNAYCIEVDQANYCYNFVNKGLYIYPASQTIQSDQETSSTSPQSSENTSVTVQSDPQTSIKNNITSNEPLTPTTNEIVASQENITSIDIEKNMNVTENITQHNPEPTPCQGDHCNLEKPLAIQTTEENCTFENSLHSNTTQHELPSHQSHWLDQTNINEVGESLFTGIKEGASATFLIETIRYLSQQSGLTNRQTDVACKITQCAIACYFGTLFSSSANLSTTILLEQLGCSSSTASRTGMAVGTAVNIAYHCSPLGVTKIAAGFAGNYFIGHYLGKTASFFSHQSIDTIRKRIHSQPSSDVENQPSQEIQERIAVRIDKFAK